MFVNLCWFTLGLFTAFMLIDEFPDVFRSAATCQMKGSVNVPEARNGDLAR